MIPKARNQYIPLYDYILNNIEDLTSVELNNLLQEHQIETLTTVLEHKFPGLPRVHLKQCLVQEYFA